MMIEVISMEQVITGRFDALHQAEGAATKLRTIRANDVEISEWNGGSPRENEMSTDGRGPGMTTFGFGPNISGLGGISGGVAGIGGGFSTNGISFLPFMGDDQDREESSGGFLLNALVQDEQRDKAVRIIRESGGREF
jgi:hypothetical protein